MHPQAVQVDARGLRAEFATLRKHPVNLQVAYSCKIHLGVGKCVDGARRHLGLSLKQGFERAKIQLAPIYV
jgi:hypothetical protein